MPVRRRRLSGGLAGAVTSTDRPSRVATVERVGQTIVVRPPFEEVLGPLVTAIHVAAVHATRGFQTMPYPVPLFVVESMPWGPQAVLPAGLEPVVLGLLERDGVEVRRTLEPVAACFTPMPLDDARIGVIDASIVDFVASHERGLIRLGKDVCAAKLVAAIRLGFPNATIAVAATRRDDVRAFGQRLKAIIPGATWVADDRFPADAGPLVVTTYLGLGDHSIAIHRRDIVICLDAAEAIRAKARFAIELAVNARLFGLIKRDLRPSPYDRDLIWAYLGFAALDVPRHGHVARPIEVVTARITGTPPEGGTDAVTLKQRGLWFHPIRNRRIARLAEALAGDGPKLAAEHPAIAARLRVTTPRVVVVVEGIEHAATLARSLRDWPLVTAPDVNTDSLPPSLAEIAMANRWFGPGQPDRAIVTLSGLSRIDLEQVDVMIRADGGHGVPSVLASGLSQAYPGDRSLILIDSDDRHHPELRRRSRERREAYRTLGWPVDNQGGPLAPIEHFLATWQERRR